MSTPQDLSSLRIDRSPPPSDEGAGRKRLFALVAGVAVLIVIAIVLMTRAGGGGVAVQVGTAEATGGGSASADGITANGYVVARTKASVSSKILGRLAWTGVTEGSKVNAGEVLARLEDADYAAAVRVSEAAVAQAEAQLAQAKRESARAVTLRRDQVIAEQQLEDAQTTVQLLTAQLQSARAQLSLAQANFENTRVRAPFSGTVLRRDAEVGEIVAPSSAGGGLTRTAIVTMADLTTLEVEVDVNEAYIAQVRNGQPARITLDAYPDTSFVGQIRQVVPTADRQKATVLVKVSITDRDPRILSEMGAKVVFSSRDAVQLAAPRRVLVPSTAVVQQGDGAFVWVVEEGAVKQVKVDVGPARGEKTEIRSGLSGGESLVLSPPASLSDGTKIKIEG